MELQRKKSGKKIVKVSDRSMHILSRYRWPGNVRELANAIALGFVLSDSDTIEPEDLPEEITQKPVRPDYRHNEYEHIITTLDRNGGSKSATAKELGMDRTTLWRKMKSYGIRQ
jgi:transcriptional regulator of acetoin/glycerol metabolism